MRETMLYSNVQTKDTILELWGGSTKHPDSRFFLSDFKCSPILKENNPANIAQWIMEIGSKMFFPYNSKKLAELALYIFTEILDY